MTGDREYTIRAGRDARRREQARAKQAAHSGQPAQNGTWGECDGKIESMVKRTARKTGHRYLVIKVASRKILVFKQNVINTLEKAGIGAEVSVNGLLKRIHKTGTDGNAYEDIIFKALQVKVHSRKTRKSHAWRYRTPATVAQ